MNITVMVILGIVLYVLIGFICIGYFNEKDGDSWGLIIIAWPLAFIFMFVIGTISIFIHIGEWLRTKINIFDD